MAVVVFMSSDEKTIRANVFAILTGMYKCHLMDLNAAHIYETKTDDTIL